MISNTSIKISFVLLFFFCSYDAQGQSRSVSSGNSSPSSISIGVYQPREFKTLDKMPEGIRMKVTNHLRVYFGEAFYSKLKFVGGAAIDLDELYQVEPNAKNYEWKIHSYELVFQILS